MPNSFPNRFRFVFSDFMEINVKNLAGKRMMLDFLHQREVFAFLRSVNDQVNEKILGDGVVNEGLDVLDLDLKTLRLVEAAVDYGRNPA